MDDDDFLKGCEIPDEPLPIAVALAARRVIAELGTVPPETIRPDDSFAHHLVQLPFWDSLDWLGFILDVEQQFKGAVRLPSLVWVIEEATWESGGDLRVKHIVRFLALAATERPKKALVDDEL
jgi:hypothetical protein